MSAEPPYVAALETGPLRPGEPRRVHVTNVGGAGMSAVAAVLAQMGHSVTGTDERNTSFVPRLEQLGVGVVIGDSHPDAALAEVVITSTATLPDHPDVIAASAAGGIVVHRRDALAAISETRVVLAVAGTHGKSTTAGMVATILDGVGTGAGFVVGTQITAFGVNADWRQGPLFVVEADESDATFLRVGAHHGLVANVEADHLAFWGSEEALVDGFRRFVSELDGTAVLCLDDAGAAALTPHASSPITYGFASDADYRIGDFEPSGIGIEFELWTPRGNVDVAVPAAPGRHNAANAAGAIALAVAGGVEVEDAVRAIGSFGGVDRRFQQRGAIGGITFVDSYDHLPTEVAAALAAASDSGFQRVVCVFQPHRYTRTRDLAATFADAFVAADVLAVTDLYPAGEAPIPGVSGRDVYRAVAAAHPDADVTFTGDLDSTLEWLLANLRPGDCCITLNAGDLTTMPDRVLEAMGGAR